MRKFWLIVLFLNPSTFFFAHCQTTYLPLGIEDYHILDRLETKSGQLTNNFFTTVKPISREAAANFLQCQLLDSGGHYSLIDDYNAKRIISINGEWVVDSAYTTSTKRPLFKRFYRNQSDFVNINNENFYLVVNPVLNIQTLHERTSYSRQNQFLNTRGIEMRGRISKKIGFYTLVTENQEETPLFYSQWVSNHRALPGVDFFTSVGNGYDYMLAKGYVNFDILRDHLNITFGYDTHFIGDGIRSLLLSDFSAGYTFLKINSQYGRLNYQKIILELTSQFYNRGMGDRLRQKYATIHLINFNVSNRVNIGLFESTVFRRENLFGMGQLVPVIYYQATKNGLNGNDNVNIGLTFKAIASTKIQLYSQLLVDNFNATSFIKTSPRVDTKVGYQIGGKIFSIAGIPTLDANFEINVVRPYTYSDVDSIGEYSHYNQPLAHPLEANFAEFLCTVQYQPKEKIRLTLESMFYKKGEDSLGINTGGDLFSDNRIRTVTDDANLFDGVKVIGISAQLNVTYEFRHNLFFDAGLGKRVFRIENGSDATTNIIYFGIRMNVARRKYIPTF